MKKQRKQLNKKLTCQIPRRNDALAALLCLAWKKPKKERPKWIVNELKSIA